MPGIAIIEGNIKLVITMFKKFNTEIIYSVSEKAMELSCISTFSLSLSLSLSLFLSVAHPGLASLISMQGTHHRPLLRIKYKRELS